MREFSSHTKITMPRTEAVATNIWGLRPHNDLCQLHLTALICRYKWYLSLYIGELLKRYGTGNVLA